MKIISIMNQKGGVAKTTSTRNIAEVLKNEGNKVLLIDLDPQANLTSSFNIDKKVNNKTIYKLFKLQTEKKEYQIEDYLVDVNGIFLIPNNIRMSKADLEFGGFTSREHILKKIMKNFTGEEFDYVLLDCPPALNLITYNALSVSNKVYIPLEAESFSLEGIADMLDTINEVKEDLNESLEIGGVFITKFKKNTNLHLTIEKNIEKYFKEKILKTRIRENIKVAESIAMKKSVVEYDKKSNGAKDYIALTKEIIKREE